MCPCLTQQLTWNVPNSWLGFLIPSLVKSDYNRDLRREEKCLRGETHGKIAQLSRRHDREQIIQLHSTKKLWRDYWQSIKKKKKRISKTTKLWHDRILYLYVYRTVKKNTAFIGKIPSIGTTGNPFSQEFRNCGHRNRSGICSISPILISKKFSHLFYLPAVV